MSDRSSSDSVERERSSSENVTIIAETFSENAGATVSSIKSEDSTEQLICKTPQQSSGRRKAEALAATLELSYDQKPAEPKGSETSEVSGAARGGHAILWLGLAQLAAGTAMLALGALVIVHGASLARVGAGLWAGGVAVGTGVVGVLAGINDSYGLYGTRRGRSGPLLTAFLALSLASLAAGNMAAVLAGTGLYRDVNRNQTPEEMEGDIEAERAAWMPVLSNIGLLIAASAHCLLALAGTYQASRRACACLRPREPYDHNQFEPPQPPAGKRPYVVHVSEKPPPGSQERRREHELCRELERKLDGEGGKGEAAKKRKVEEGFGSANSKDKLVTSWLGRHQAPGRRGGAGGVRKVKLPQPIMLVPAHAAVSSRAASTLGRGGLPVPLGMVAVGRRYATLPPPPPPPPHYLPPHHLYYPVHDVRGRRRRSPRAGGGGGAGGASGAGGGAERRTRGARAAGARGSQLTRSLERIHRKSRVSDAELRRTYTGLDRTIAEQFIAVCDESRAHPAGTSATPAAAAHADSSACDTASSDCHSNRY